MNKSELINAVAEKTNLTKREAEAVVNGVFDSIAEALAKGEKVQVVGFGTFETHTRAARPGRNPQNGEQITIPETRVPAFKAGKALKDLVRS